VPYATPAAHLIPVADAPVPPLAYLAPGGRFLALVHVQPHPPIELLARPWRPLAGLRIDPALRARRRLRRTTGLSVLSVADGAERPAGLPAGAQVGTPAWAPDGHRFAVTVDRADGVAVWVADAAAGEAREVPGLTVCDVLAGDPSDSGGVLRWSRDGRWLLALATPPGWVPPLPRAPEPRVAETAGQHSQLVTFQDLLATPGDADAFERLAASQPYRVDPATGERAELGPPGLYYGLLDSPDGKYLLVHRLQRPFSFRVPWFWFGRRIEIWEAGGRIRTVIADLAPSEEVPRQGVPTGPRLAGWVERAPASVVWAEALDGGDPVAPAEHRDRIFGLAAPFGGPPRPLFDLRHRCLGWWDLGMPGQALVVEHDRNRRWLTTWQCDLAGPGRMDSPGPVGPGQAGPGRRRVVFDRPADDAYGDPGTPLMTVNPDGTRTALGDGSAIYLRGAGATPAGKRPFLDRFDLATLAATRLHQSPPGCAEQVIGLSAEREVLVWHESPAEPPNLAAVRLDGGGRRSLTAWPDPRPQYAGVSRRLVVHDRGDGVTLSGLLYLPPGYDPAAHGRLPLVVWAYPDDYGGADTAGQVRAGSFEFIRLTATGPAVFALAGYAVLAAATMPVIGDPETMNDTYLEQITAAARAHIRALDKAGIADPRRVAVGGHSYGGFMAANLLAHTTQFAAGIARSGAYNRTLTPFGFQTERRSFWEAPDIYDRVSPLRHAHLIRAPLLLVHGEEDPNPGTHPVQSERLFQAIAGNGGTARLVVLPYEGHAYLARQSVLHLLAEEFGWLERWLGPGWPGPGGEQAAPAARTGKLAGAGERASNGEPAGPGGHACPGGNACPGDPAARQLAAP
jgi:dipeptidyl aminopeptidase/acylaminoacyl peptidase